MLLLAQVIFLSEMKISLQEGDKNQNAEAKGIPAPPSSKRYFFKWYTRVPYTYNLWELLNNKNKLANIVFFFAFFSFLGQILSLYCIFIIK